MRTTLLAASLTLCAGLPSVTPGEEPAQAPPASPQPSAVPPAPGPSPEAPATPVAPVTVADRPSRGFTFGLRGAWAKPLGEIAGEVDSSSARRLDEEFGVSFPFTVEAGYRFANGVTAGGYFGIGRARVDAALNGACASLPTSCDSGRMQRLGIQLTYHLQRVRPFTPWLGAGTGYEWTGFDLNDPMAGSGRVTYQGWEIVNLQLGGDYALSRRFFLGPFVSMSYARYAEVEVEAEGTSATFELAEKKIHGWLQIGIRARFDP